MNMINPHIYSTLNQPTKPPTHFLDITFPETIVLDKVKGLIIRSNVRAAFKGGNARQLFDIKGESDVTFVGIDFKEGKTTASTSNSVLGKGGAISIVNSKVTISSATFSNNKAYRRCPQELSTVYYHSSCQCIFSGGSCANKAWDGGTGGALYLANKAMVFLSAVQFQSNYANWQGTDVWVSDDSELTCTAGCTTTGMYMPSGTCTTPSAAASVHGGSCVAHCSTADSKDCAVCGRSIPSFEM